MELKYSAGLSHSCKCPAQCLAHSRPFSNSPDDYKQRVYIDIYIWCRGCYLPMCKFCAIHSPNNFLHILMRYIQFLFSF